MIKKIIIFIAASILIPYFVNAQTRVVAHRGFWKTEGSAKNSITSLRKAAEIGVYGSEFDVNVTSDGVPIVTHDPKIGDKVIDQTLYEEFKDVKLSNGESLPTLVQYLEEGAKHPQMKLILEIKSGSSPELETKAVDAIIVCVNQSGRAAQVEYIAFSRHIVETLLKRDKGLTVAYLNGDLSAGELKKMGCPGLDYNVSRLRNDKSIIKEAKKDKIFINVWTVNKPEDIEYMIDQEVDFITTDVPKLVQKTIAAKQK